MDRTNAWLALIFALSVFHGCSSAAEDHQLDLGQQEDAVTDLIIEFERDPEVQVTVNTTLSFGAAGGVAASDSYVARFRLATQPAVGQTDSENYQVRGMDLLFTSPNPESAQ